MAVGARLYSLILNIGKECWASPRFSIDTGVTDVDWLDAPNSVLSTRYFQNEVPIGAILRGPIEGCKFRLRIPYDGDDKRWLSNIDEAGRMYVKRRGERIYHAPLLHQAVGVYTLVLEAESDDGDFFPVLNIPIEVETEDSKLAIVNGMIDEILAFDHLPFQVLSQDKATVWGRIKMFYSDDSRKSGHDVSWSRYEALKGLVEKLAPLLSAIFCDGASRLGSKEMFCRVRDLHNFDRSIIRQVARRGASELSNLSVQSWTVRALELVPSRDIPAHRVIKTFLETCARECVSVLNRLIRDLGEEGIVNIRKRQLGLQKAEFDRKLLPFFARNLQEIKSWCQDGQDILVEAADPSWFSISYEYKQIYSLMLRYRMVMKGRRIESGALANVDYRRMECGRPSTLQKKYDYIYEAWCYLRLVKAFICLGFEELKDVYYNNLGSDDVTETFLPHELINRPLIAKKRDLTVMLYYRVRAETSDEAEFYLPPKGKDKIRQMLEPDYLIVFSKEGSDDRYAIIMDAKAKAEVVKADRDTRDDYLLRFDLNDYHHFSEQAKHPAQSWLFYLGSGSDDNARVEFSQTGDSDLDAMNKGCLFSPDTASVEKFDFSEKHAGHLRVNVRAIEELNGGDVFMKWVSTQVRLANRYLSQGRGMA